MADAGFRLSVEGEKEFKAALKEIDAQIKANKSELKLLTAEYKLNGDGLEGLQRAQDALADVMGSQQEKIEEIRKQYEAVAEEYGETSEAAIKLKDTLAKATDELAKSSTQWKKNEDALAEYRTGTDELKGTMEQMDAVIRANASELALLDARYGGTEESAEGLRKKNEVLADSIEKQNEKINALTKALNAAQGEFGEQSAEVMAYREQLNNAQTELIGMTKQVEQNNEELQKTGNMDMGGLLDGLDEVLGKVGIEMPDAIKEVTKGFDLTSVAVGGVTTAITAAITELVKLRDETMAWADELTGSASVMGVTTEEYQAMEYAMMNLGVEMDVLDDAFNELNTKVGETHEVTGKYIGDFEALQNATEEERRAVSEASAEWEKYGIMLYDQEGNLRSTTEIFHDIIEVFHDMPAGIERSKAMIDIFGESARQLNPLVEAGGDALKRLEEQAYSTGYVMSSDMVADMDAAANATKRLKSSWDAMWRKFAATFKEKFSLQGLTETLGDLWNLVSGGYNTPQYASGTDYHPGGLAIVGEKGPELVNLPRGSQVIPNTELPMMGGEIHQTVNVYVDHVESLRDIERIADGQRTNLRMGYVRG